jgi:hypothetical protein
MDTKDLTIFWYSIWAYRRLKHFSREEILTLVKEIDDIITQNPLYEMPCKKWKLKFEKMENEELTSYQLLALFIVGVDILTNGQVRERFERFKFLNLAKVFEN